MRAYFVTLFLVVSTWGIPVFAAETGIDIEKVLTAADRFRLPAETARVESTVELYKNDVLQKSRDYRVYLKPGRRSLVQFRSPQEIGRKVLMVEEKFWMLMPTSRRPVRITATQKLLGEASTGDVATMTWSEYYSGTLLDAAAEYKGQAALHLELRSKVKGTTYARIELWVTREDFVPLAADLFVKSGKLAKQATYVIAHQNGERRITQMILEDKIQKNQRTEVLIRSVEATELADKYFNPMFLIRNNLDD